MNHDPKKPTGRGIGIAAGVTTLSAGVQSQRPEPNPANPPSPRLHLTAATAMPVDATVTGRYWLHVLPDGTEKRFSDPPEFYPCKIVEFCDEFEETFTKDGSWPPGRGWTYEGYDDLGFSIWRRQP